MGTRRDVASRRSAPSGHVATTTRQRGPFSRCHKVPFLVAISRHQAYPRQRTAVGRVTNDTQADWAAAYALFPGDVAYVWHAALFADVVMAGLRQAQFEVRSQIVWAKPTFVLGRGAYHWQHEPAWFAVRQGRAAPRLGGPPRAAASRATNPPSRGCVAMNAFWNWPSSAAANARSPPRSGSRRAGCPRPSGASSRDGRPP